MEHEALTDTLLELIVDPEAEGTCMAGMSKGDASFLSVADREDFNLSATDEGKFLGAPPPDGADTVERLEPLHAPTAPRGTADAGGDNPPRRGESMTRMRSERALAVVVSFVEVGDLVLGAVHRSLEQAVPTTELVVVDDRFDDRPGSTASSAVWHHRSAHERSSIRFSTHELGADALNFRAVRTTRST